MPVIEWANCAECKQARLVAVLNEDGVCPLCTMPVLRMPENPLFGEPTPPPAANPLINHDIAVENAHTISSLIALRPWIAP